MSVRSYPFANSLYFVLSLAEFEQFQYNIELDELDEWIIDDEVYSAAMDVAPVDHLEALEQSLAQMTRHNHRERRHQRTAAPPAHRKTRRRKPPSPVVREAIGPVRTRYTRNHHTTNNNNAEEEDTQLIDLAGEPVEESEGSKYNLRKRKSSQVVPDELIELCTTTEPKDPEMDLVATGASLVANVNDGRHFDRRSAAAKKKIIVKPTELNLPVAMFNDKLGDHDISEASSEEEIVQHDFLSEEVQIKPKLVEDRAANEVQSRPEEKIDELKAPSGAQFSLTDIPFTDEDAEKVLPIDGASDLSVNNVSINNVTPELVSKPNNNLQPVSNPFVSVTKPLAPYPSAKKTPGIPPKFLSSPAIERPPSTKTIIKEFKVPNAEPMSGVKAQIANKLKPKDVQPQSTATTSTEEPNGEPKSVENGANNTPPKRTALAGRKGKEKRTTLSAKVASKRALQNNEKKTAVVNSNLIANDSSQNTIKTDGIDAEKLKSVSFKKKTTAANNTPSTVVQSQSEQTNVAETSAAPVTATDVVSNTNATTVTVGINAQGLNGTTSLAADKVNNDARARGELNAPSDATVSGLTTRIDSLIDKIAPVLSLDFAGVEQHGKQSYL